MSKSTYADQLINDAVESQLVGIVDRLVEGMKPHLKEWLELKVTPQNALDEAMRHIDKTLEHPSLKNASNLSTVREAAYRKLKFHLRVT